MQLFTSVVLFSVFSIRLRHGSILVDARSVNLSYFFREKNMKIQLLYTLVDVNINPTKKLLILSNAFTKLLLRNFALFPLSY
jgi:hypothetical protein